MRIMRFAAAGQNGACGVSTESPRRGGVRNAGFVAVRAPGEEKRNIEVFTGREMAGKWGKWPKLGKFQKNQTIPTPQKLYYLELPLICKKSKREPKWTKITKFNF